MKTTIIENATIVTCDPAKTVLHNAAIAIKGSRIATLGPHSANSRRLPQRSCR